MQEQNRKAIQIQLPIFPSTTKSLSPTWGVFEDNNFVYYLHNGSPVHTHKKGDLKSFRYIIASLIVNHSCRATDLAEVFGFGVRNFERYAKKLREGGSGSFFQAQRRGRGQCHKMTPERLVKAQQCIDAGFSNTQTAKEIGVHEASIRYHIKKGTLKKSL